MYKHINQLKHNGFKVLEINDKHHDSQFILKTDTDIPFYYDEYIYKNIDSLQYENNNALLIILNNYNIHKNGEFMQKLIKYRSKSLYHTIFMDNDILYYLDMNDAEKNTCYKKRIIYTPLFSIIHRNLNFTRPKVILVSNFFNEELLLPQFIKQHENSFDEAVLLNWHSTDNSVDIINKLAPKTWRVINTKYKYFDVVESDNEIKEVEDSLPLDAWKITLTTTEFLIHPNLRYHLSNTDATYTNDIATEIYNTYDINYIHKLDGDGDGDVDGVVDLHKINVKLNPYCRRFPSRLMIGNDADDYNPKIPLISQRTEYWESPSTQIYARFIHRNMKCPYVEGRHGVLCPYNYDLTGFIFKYNYTPWTETRARKMQIQTKMNNDLSSPYKSWQHRYNSNDMEIYVNKYKTCEKDDLQKLSIPKPDSIDANGTGEDVYLNSNLTYISNVIANITNSGFGINARRRT